VLVQVLDKDFEVTIELIRWEAGLYYCEYRVLQLMCKLLTMDTAGFLLPLTVFLFDFLKFRSGANSSASSKYSYSGQWPIAAMHAESTS
jgi:hypothetical protein